MILVFTIVQQGFVPRIPLSALPEKEQWFAPVQLIYMFEIFVTPYSIWGIRSCIDCE